MIDLRSDTVTQPTKGMRNAIANAIVGDDVLGDDPTVVELEKNIAGILGKEAALFVPSGTMGNQISIGILTKPGDEIICDFDSHIFQYEAGAPAMISGVQLRGIKTEKGMIPETEIENAIRGNDVHFPQTSLICIENTHNRHGGTIIDLDYIKRVKAIADKHKILMHCDGARLWNACTATGIPPIEYAKPFDTVTVCLSKALGAPVGSVIASGREIIAKARRRRKQLGGGMRQVGILASAGIYALEHHLDLLKQDHENAKLFAQGIAQSDQILISLEKVETNIVIFRLSEKIEPSEFIRKCQDSGLRIIPMGGGLIRAVFHFEISREDTMKAIEIILQATK